MAEHEAEQSDAGSEASTELRGGAYELIRNRLNNQSKALRERLKGLNEARKAAFGAVETKLLSSDRVSTANNCVPRDIVPIGDHFLFGYNVFVGLRTETHLEDVFALYRLKEGNFTQEPLDLLANPQFAEDFKNLYKYYRRTTFAKFSLKGPHLFMVFRVGRDTKDIKTFKWLVQGDKFTYLDNRSDHEFGFPPQHEFEWQRATRDMFREGRHPHVSIEDRVFVETIGGDLTIKIENNTESGEGIYTERVDHLDQTLSDALIYFAIIGNVILLKIRPYEEEAFRYILYNEKIQKAMRIDAIEEACVLLPENHGLIFPKGYYLQTGVFKLFETDMEEMVFERSLPPPTAKTRSTSSTTGPAASIASSPTTSSSKKSVHRSSAMDTPSLKTAPSSTSARTRRPRNTMSSRAGRHPTPGRTSPSPYRRTPNWPKSATGTLSAAWPNAPRCST